MHSQGLTDANVHNEVLVDLIRQHLISKGVSVDDSQVDAFIKAHPQEFTDPAKAALLFVQVGSAAKRARVDAELSTKKFDAVAAQFSESPRAKETNCIYPISIVAEMPKKVQDAVNATPEKKATDWVVDGSTYTKLYVVKKDPSVVRKPTPEQKVVVKRVIAQQQGQVKNDFNRKFLERLKSSKIDVEVPYLKDLWDKAWNQLAK